MYDAGFHEHNTEIHLPSRASFKISEARIVWNVGSFGIQSSANTSIRHYIPIFEEEEGTEGFRWTDGQTRSRLISLATGDQIGYLVVHYIVEPVKEDILPAKKSELVKRDMDSVKRERGPVKREREPVKGDNDWEVVNRGGF